MVDAEALTDALDHYWPSPNCPVCNQSDRWRPAPTASVWPTVEPDGAILIGPATEPDGLERRSLTGTQIIAFVCGECGFIRTHLVDAAVEAMRRAR
jgi:hypothetical protein